MKVGENQVIETRPLISFLTLAKTLLLVSMLFFESHKTYAISYLIICVLTFAIIIYWTSNFKIGMAFFIVVICALIAVLQDVDLFESVTTQHAVDKTIRGVAYNNDGSVFVTCGRDNVAEFYDAATNKLQYKLEDIFVWGLEDASFAPKGNDTMVFVSVNELDMFSDCVYYVCGLCIDWCDCP